MTLEKIQRTGKDTFILHDLGMILSVSKHIESGDAQALARLERSTGDKQAFYDTVRASVAWRTMNVDRASSGISKMSTALWMIPIVARSGVPAASRNQQHNQRWIRDYFGMHQSVVTLDVIPTHESLSLMRPVEVHQLLEMMIGLRETASLRPESTDKTVLHSHLPMLQFIVGTVSRYGEPPVLPDDAEGAAALSNKLANSLAFEVGHFDPYGPAGFRVGTAMGFGDAIVQGMTMWLEELDSAFPVRYWCMDADSAEKVTLALAIDVQGRETGLGVDLLNWHLGSEGRERILEACPWQMQRTFGQADPRSSVLLS